MKQGVSVILQIAFLVLFALIIVSVLGRYNERKRTVIASNLKLNINDSLYTEFVNNGTVLALLDDVGIVIGESLIKDIPLHKVEDYLKQDKYIDDINAYTNVLGDVIINIKQFPPLLRLIDQNGDSYFVDKGLRVVPHRGAVYGPLPVVSQSGDVLPIQRLSMINIKDSSELNSVDIEGLKGLRKVVDFVDYISKDDVYSDMFTQVNISKNKDIELYPRIGNHYVIFSSMDSLHNYESKLRKLDKFYKSQSNNGVWSEYKSINLKYRGQVVCKKRKGK